MKEAELQESLLAEEAVEDLRVGTPAFVDIGQEHPEPAPFRLRQHCVGRADVYHWGCLGRG